MKKIINNAVVTFTTAGRYVDYCDGCQQLGKTQVSGVKRHRSLPLDTYLVAMNNSDFPGTTKESVFCADCLESANKQEAVNVMHNGEPIKREGSGMFFMGD
tara:strand:- start:464 stop:766 length:303 start_codon:yes stop_codon:yes gene_type:complete